MLLAAATSAQPPGDRNASKIVDLAELSPGSDPLTRLHGGPNRFGFLGVPVAGGFDVDGDSFVDYGVGYFLASPGGVFASGEVFLRFGNGTIGEAVDLGVPAQPRLVRFTGNGLFEATGSEIWMGDVTGDGLGDLIVCRQNFDPSTTGGGSRIGAGAVSLVVGSASLRQHATVDLDHPPPDVRVLTLVGAQANGRLGIWARVGDVDGDGVDDLTVAADKESDAIDTDHGAVYVVRGGLHLAASAVVDLAGFGATQLAGHIARVRPPAGASPNFHFGATHQVGDLDGNGRAELLVGATINRAGAVLGPNGFGGDAVGGPPGGAVFVVWDDLFPAAPWPAGLDIELGSSPGSVTRIDGGLQNRHFGEEILGGLDYDDDGRAELFIGDLVGSPDPMRNAAGLGYAFFKAERLKGLRFNIDEPPPGVPLTRILGPTQGAIGSDTVAQGDFDGDGFDDLAIGNPTDNPLGRFRAGTVHVLHGRPGGWPRVIDTAPGSLPPQESLRITEVRGARGRVFDPSIPFFDEGDILCYSATAADVDGDGKTDLITNEMEGNGLGPNTLDVGNLVVLSGVLISAPPPGS